MPLYVKMIPSSKKGDFGFDEWRAAGRSVERMYTLHQLKHGKHPLSSRKPRYRSCTERMASEMGKESTMRRHTEVQTPKPEAVPTVEAILSNIAQAVQDLVDTGKLSETALEAMEEKRVLANLGDFTSEKFTGPLTQVDRDLAEVHRIYGKLLNTRNTLRNALGIPEGEAFPNSKRPRDCAFGARMTSRATGQTKAGDILEEMKSGLGKLRGAEVTLQYCLRAAEAEEETTMQSEASGNIKSTDCTDKSVMDYPITTTEHAVDNLNIIEQANTMSTTKREDDPTSATEQIIAAVMSEMEQAVDNPKNRREQAVDNSMSTKVHAVDNLTIDGDNLVSKSEEAENDLVRDAKDDLVSKSEEAENDLVRDAKDDLVSNAEEADDIVRDAENGHDLVKDAENEHDLVKDAENEHDLVKDAENGHDLVKDAENGHDLVKDAENGHDLVKDAENGDDFCSVSEDADLVSIPEDVDDLVSIPEDADDLVSIPEDADDLMSSTECSESSDDDLGRVVEKTYFTTCMKQGYNLEDTGAGTNDSLFSAHTKNAKAFQDLEDTNMQWASEKLRPRLERIQAFAKIFRIILSGLFCDGNPEQEESQTTAASHSSKLTEGKVVTMHDEVVKGNGLGDGDRAVVEVSYVPSATDITNDQAPRPSPDYVQSGESTGNSDREMLASLLREVNECIESLEDN